jgi:hypothetical protein
VTRLKAEVVASHVNNENELSQMVRLVEVDQVEKAQLRALLSASELARCAAPLHSQTVPCAWLTAPRHGLPAHGAVDEGAINSVLDAHASCKAGALCCVDLASLRAPRYPPANLAAHGQPAIVLGAIWIRPPEAYCTSTVCTRAVDRSGPVHSFSSARRCSLRGTYTARVCWCRGASVDRGLHLQLPTVHLR